ncbi:hypothetical protein Ana3638_03620 [Anaerocolumna sedimenticola]|uniref:Uncharacterized protein n=1 Tax=Anaerocolumna sedimenticola TaxID=2696063 RepID=A0A6P1TIQ7_9FIRM|nr:hypothetical protein [Anaerocolumna sedimenticola]QHQ59982.1 hypothetical protein Ana3638_03620 [Anaerocolumna sedimenticola]
MSKQTAPTLVTFSMLIILMSIVILVGNLKTKDEISVPSITNKGSLIQEEKNNITEKTVLTVLENSLNQLESQKNMAGNEYATYISQLENYFKNSNVNLEESELTEVANKIAQLLALMKLEQKNDFTKMSFDGRELALRISSEIYHICGLKLSVSTQGNIMEVQDSSGKIIYETEKNAQQPEFQWNTLIISVTFIFYYCLSI